MEGGTGFTSLIRKRRRYRPARIIIDHSNTIQRRGIQRITLDQFNANTIISGIGHHGIGRKINIIGIHSRVIPSERRA